MKPVPYYDQDGITIYHGDCLTIMPMLEVNSVNMILADLPYGTTACPWDTVIPFEDLWRQYGNVCKINSAIVLTASQPFTTNLIASNLDGYQHAWIWNKQKPGNFAICKSQPMRITEDVLVFSSYGKIRYFPQMTIADGSNMRTRYGSYNVDDGTQGMKSFQSSEGHDEGSRYPVNVINIKSTEGECNNTKRVHPTQKPVGLMEYLIKTYSSEGDVILDNTVGSGTTLVAARNTGRKAIGIEREEKYCKIAVERLGQQSLFQQSNANDDRAGASPAPSPSPC